MGKKAHTIDGLVKGGPYSHAVEAGGLIFFSGMVPVDMDQGITITDDIQAAARLTLDNIKRALEGVGSSLENVVKATVYLKDMADFNALNEVYATYFKNDPPARTCVAVRELPLNVPIEIEVVATR